MHLDHGKLAAFYAIGVFLFLHMRVIGQAPYYLHYGTQEGLLNVEVYDILEDSTGFIWIASDHGVSRFDGRNFRHFSIKDGLPHNLVTELFLDLEGRVWCTVHRNGLVCIERDSVFIPQWVKRLAPYQKEFNYFGQLSDGRYALGYQTMFSDSSLLFAIVSGEGDSIELVRHTQGNLMAILPDDRSPVYASQYSDATQPNHLVWGIPSSHRIRELDIVSPKQVYQDMISSAADSQAFYSIDNYLYSVLPGGQQCIDVKQKITNSLFIDDQQNLWAGLFEGGALCFERASLQASPKRYLEGYSVTSVMQDRNGGFWFSTIEAGIFHMPFLDLRVYTVDNGLPENRIVKAWRSDSTLWMIYRNGYVTRTRLGEDETLLFETVVRNEFIGPTFVDTNGVLNISATGVTKSSVPVKQWPYKSALHIASNGVLYSGDPNGGLDKIYPNGRVWSSATAHPGMGRINHIVESEDGVIWLGGTNGLYCMMGDTCVFMPDTYPELAGSVTSIHIHDKEIFIGVGGKGLFVLRGDSLIHLYSRNGLSSDFIHRIEVDDRDTVWLATTSGIDLFPLKAIGHHPIPLQHLGAGSGLPSVCVNDLLITNGEVWAFTDGGLAVIPRSIITRRDALLPVYLTSFKVNGIPRDLGSGLQLLHNENNLQVEFQAITFRGLSGILYAYRLNGPESTWNYTRVPSVNLSGLKPGDYTLEVKHGHVINDFRAGPLTLQFTILPPLWQRWYTLLPAVMLLLAGLYLLLNWRMRNLRWAARMEQQVTSLTFRALQAQMNPHFIYNSLNAIQSFILRNDQKASIEYLNKFSRLTRSVFDHSARELVPLSEELTNIELYISLEQARYPGVISFEMHLGESVRSLKVPPMLLQPFIENAILHGILPANRPGQITLAIRIEGDRLAVRIEDNGIGIRAHRLLRLKKDRFLNPADQSLKRAHSGIRVTWQRIEALWRKHGLEAHVDIEDRSSTSLNETGTLVFFTLPILRNT